MAGCLKVVANLNPNFKGKWKVIRFLLGVGFNSASDFFDKLNGRSHEVLVAKCLSILGTRLLKNVLALSRTGSSDVESFIGLLAVSIVLILPVLKSSQTSTYPAAIKFTSISQ